MSLGLLTLAFYIRDRLVLCTRARQGCRCIYNVMALMREEKALRVLIHASFQPVFRYGDGTRQCVEQCVVICKTGVRRSLRLFRGRSREYASQRQI